MRYVLIYVYLHIFFFANYLLQMLILPERAAKLCYRLNFVLRCVRQI